jgi:hypothetical protein
VSRISFEFAEPTDAPKSDTEFAQARVPGRLYTSKTFPNGNPNSTDYGQPSRFVYRVVDGDENASVLVRDGEEWTVTPIAGSRTQIKILVSREAGRLVDMWIQRVPEAGAPGSIKDLLRLRREDAIRLAEFFRQVWLIEPGGAQAGIRIDDDVLAEVLNNPDSATRLYESQAPVMRALIAEDANAKDLIAHAGRKAALLEFKKMLEDAEYFASVVKADSGVGPEAVWQHFFEANPWILGIGLGSQLLTSWSNEKLEQVVRGHSISGDGKRVDALLRTSGIINSMVFAEIKTHKTALLRAKEYRPGVWAMSQELAGGVNQTQVTVHEAVSQMGQRLASEDQDGYETGDTTYLVKPRSYLIIGSLSEFTDSEGHHNAKKFRSFELTRRGLLEPEVITFDELLARAQWIVESAAAAEG